METNLAIEHEHAFVCYVIGWDMNGFHCEDCEEELKCPDCECPIFTFDFIYDISGWSCWKCDKNVTNFIKDHKVIYDD